MTETEITLKLIELNSKVSNLENESLYEIDRLNAEIRFLNFRIRELQGLFARHVEKHNESN
jgi:hypothetical protein